MWQALEKCNQLQSRVFQLKEVVAKALKEKAEVSEMNARLKQTLACTKVPEPKPKPNPNHLHKLRNCISNVVSKEWSACTVILIHLYDSSVEVQRRKEG